MAGKVVEYYSGIFDGYKEQKSIDRWDGFRDIMLGLGYEMDCCHGFQEYCQLNHIEASASPTSREDRRWTLYVLEHAPRKVVGDYLFSIWRYYTHWTMHDQYDDDYTRRILRILEAKYEEESVE